MEANGLKMNMWKAKVMLGCIETNAIEDKWSGLVVFGRKELAYGSNLILCPEMAQKCMLSTLQEHMMILCTYVHRHIVTTNGDCIKWS